MASTMPVTVSQAVSDESHIFFCGLAIGVADLSAPINHFQRHREPLEDKVRFLGF